MSTGNGKGLYRMPSLGADMESGTLIEWVKQPGESFEKGDVIAVVETQKGAIEVEVFQDGVLGRLLVEPGETVPVGTPMAELEPAGGAPAAAQPQPVEPAAAERSAPESEAVAHQPGTAPPAPGAGAAVPLRDAVDLVGEQVARQIAEQAVEPLAGGAQPPSMTVSKSPAAEVSARPMQRRRPASPAARQLAGELGLPLTDVTGTGPGGAIVLQDVRAAAAARQAPSSSGRTVDTTSQPPPEPLPPLRRGLDLAAMRDAIAAAMSRSKREIPHYYLAHDIDLTTAGDWLARYNAELSPDRRMLTGVLFFKAVAVTLRDFPELNGFDRDGCFEPGAGIHVGSAIVIRGGGLIAPAIHDADRLDMTTLMEQLRDLVTRVRAGTLRSSELSDPTVTVSSLGERGVDRLYGIIYPPQTAIVGFGTPGQRPWVIDDQVKPRLMVTATLAADHRHSDGHRGALFLARLGQRLQEPDKL